MHRPRYDDWSWAKGKLDAGEQWPVAAAREVHEETGYAVRLGRPLPTSTYTLLDRTGARVTKEVRYWAAEVIGGDGVLQHEIDEVAWLDVATASTRLDYARDRDQLRALVRADQRGHWPPGRWSWSGTPTLRPGARGPAATTGCARSTARAGSEPSRSAHCWPRTTCAGSSPPMRCAAPTRWPPTRRRAASGCGCAPACPRRGTRPTLRPAWARWAGSSAARGRPPCAATARCCPACWTSCAAWPRRATPEVTQLLTEAIDERMAKGEVLVAHLVGSGEQARVVDVERYLP